MLLPGRRAGIFYVVTFGVTCDARYLRFFIVGVIYNCDQCLALGHRYPRPRRILEWYSISGLRGQLAEIVTIVISVREVRLDFEGDYRK